MDFRRSKRRIGGQPNIVPMIDVVFFLLVFFMLFTSLREAATSFDIDLPQVISDTAQHSSTFEIAVSREGNFYINGTQVNDSELRNALLKAKENNPNVFVIVKGDKRTDFENVVNAMDNIRQIGVYDLGLAVQIMP